MAKAATWAYSDAEARKHGEQTGLDTLVVHALNDVHWVEEVLSLLNRSESVKCTARGYRDW